MREKVWPHLKINLSLMPSWEMVIAGIGCGLIISGAILTFSFFSQYQEKIYPNIFINQQLVGGLTLTEAEKILIANNSSTTSFTLTLTVDDIKISSTSAQLEVKPDYASALQQAFQIGRSHNLLQNLAAIIRVQQQRADITTTNKFNPDKLLEMIQHLGQKVDKLATDPTATLAYSGTISSLKIDPGQVGRQIQLAETLNQIQTQAQFTDQTIDAQVASVGAQLMPEQITMAQKRASLLVNKKVKFQHETTSLYLNDQELIELLAFPEGFSQKSINELIDEWEKIVNRPPQNADFKFDVQTLRVENFVPHRDGLKINREQTAKLISETVATIEKNPDNKDEMVQQLAVEVAKPEKSLAATNDLGISELIGFGESYYAHSIPGRVHNVALTTSRINNTIVKPGEEFSFNQALGDVSSATGFKPAYVIKEGKTVLGDGGGVCQVSSTTFRALLNAGLNITKRKPHSYRVSYYELNSDPGFDATVYAGDVDLRFINDTGQHLIIHGETDSDRLYMKIEIYGTSDGRKAEISQYKQWGYRPPPPSQYYPDPSLPPGRLKQIDWSASGINTSFVYTVKDKNGNLMWERTYESRYQPWSAKFLRGV